MRASQHHVGLIGITAALKNRSVTEVAAANAHAKQS